ncbi:2569_t:CDS:2 [Ambispora gerdemannii]|uniref:2569_t:CDS:1 n=1 Tax=Ambispora gerdemannii TaxID=144530 RepID=A0A9N9CGF5_9GLOM|nr:2569_t:CDS:2 [Ambispora gerdemannii]
MVDTERTPLLNRGDEESTLESSHKDLCKRLCQRLCTRETLLLFLLGLILVFLVLNVVILYIVQTNEPQLPTDISIIPNHYQLRVSSRFAINFRWDYVLEVPPPLDLASLPIRENKEQVKNYLLELNEKYSPSDNRIASNNSTNYPNYPFEFEFAELVSRSYKLWSPAYYEMREDRYDEAGNAALVVTTVASTEFNFFSTAPSVIVSFTRAKELEADIQACQYKITWTSPVSDGLIKRKCPQLGERKFKTISVVKGSSEWGMEFFDANENEHYAIATPYPDAPFPPVLPAIYTAYYDYHTNRKNANNLKENQ